MSEAPYDVVIIGGGHNGLVCSAYLAQAGKRVKVLERRSIVGGTAVTEEFYPGFRNSTASYTVSLLNPKIINDLSLHQFGLKVVERRMSNFWPRLDGDYFSFPNGADALQQECARVSKKDALALPSYLADIDLAVDVLRNLILQTPPNAGGGWREWLKAACVGNRLRKLDVRTEQLLLDLFTRSASEFLSMYFESEHIKAAFAFDSIVGFFGSPHTPGSAYVLLHHAFGEINGKRGVWGHALGGMGAVTQAMARAAEARGVEIATDSPVRHVLVENGKACGVEMESGAEIRARAVAANVGPKLLYLRMIDEEHLPNSFRARMQHYSVGSGVFRMNVALAELPQFTCLKDKTDKADFYTSGIVIGPSLDYLDSAYRDARELGWSKNPIVEMVIASTLDDSLSPKGQHVASLFCQQFSYDLPGGKSWSVERERCADLIVETVNKYAPNFKKSILGRQVLSPLDLETKFGLVGGDIFHGRLSLDQMFSARPLLGYADYRSPISGLYLCGAGAHPGGGVTGAPGHNAAREILRDL